MYVSDMSALPELPEWIEQDRLRKAKDVERWERRGLEIELNTWGRWIDTYYDFKGYPGMDTLEAMLHGAGGGSADHKILCIDMPIVVYAVHGRIIRLTEKYQEALHLKYAVRLKEDGTFWKEEELCLVSGIQLESFRRRLRRAKQKLLGLDTDPVDKIDIA